ncbi:hypothetical protein [Streptomyces sp. enrichment culture]|uniref:hypothetical protein n=1 Tax=Streptomyces sp. enrichment culture TaxID=1795815 RepID=UPI003F5428CA
MSDTTRRPLTGHPGTGHGPDVHRDPATGPTGTTGTTGTTGVHGGTPGPRDDAYGRTDGTAGPGPTPGDGQPSGPQATTGRTADPTATGAAAGTDPFGDGRTASAPGAGHRPGHDGSGATLLPHGELDALTAQLHHAVSGFVDAPREAVEEADQVLQELTARFTEAVTERRRTLRRSWQTAEGSPEPAAAATDTEQLRLALRDYRELAERLLHV